MSPWYQFRTAAAAFRRRQPRTHWQVWLSVAALPLAVLIIGVGLRLIFHTWPEFAATGAVVTIGYVALRGTARSRALRRRRIANGEPGQLDGPIRRDNATQLSSSDTQVERYPPMNLMALFTGVIGAVYGARVVQLIALQGRQWAPPRPAPSQLPEASQR